MKKWSQDEIIKAMCANMHLQMTYLAKHVPSIECILKPDIAIVRSEIQDDTFNYVLSARFTEKNAHTRVTDILHYFQKSKMPFSWWVSPLDTPANLDSVLQSQGLSLKEINTGMYCELDAFSQAASSTLQFKQVYSQKELKDFSDVIVSVGGSDKAYASLYSKVPLHLYQNAKAFEMHVAYLENHPIVTGMLVLHADCAGLYYVATDPNHRKKGYGTQMMEHLLSRAKAHGYHLATLQASGAGKTLYARLGFKALCEFKEYVQH